jgi:hypothetical protein
MPDMDRLFDAISGGMTGLGLAAVTGEACNSPVNAGGNFDPNSCPVPAANPQPAPAPVYALNPTL